MDKQICLECAKAMMARIRNEVNGYVKYEIYPEVDTIIFKVSFKDFDFNYGINNVQDIMISDSIGEAVAEFLKKYRKAILNGFFKTEERKRREETQAYA